MSDDATQDKKQETKERPAAPTLLQQLAQQAIALHVSASAIVAQTESLVMAIRSLQAQLESLDAVDETGTLTREQLLGKRSATKRRPSTFGQPEEEL